ncbi:hypothetical protein, partial [Stenotrophomonas sp. GbtcB23]|uniref:hypothetical protein n=1 Tax=Stenotrophomonas sp. GbtcB23 TaxID=2824768 RepID=UPI001C2F6225
LASLGLIALCKVSCFAVPPLVCQQVPCLELSQSFGRSLNSIVVVVCRAHLVSLLSVYESIKKIARVKLSVTLNLSCYRDREDLKEMA